MTLQPGNCICCFSSNENIIDIFSDAAKQNNIRSILSTHFWFQVHETENFPKHICLDCWQKTEAFNVFYSSAKAAHEAYLNRLLNTESENNGQKKVFKGLSPIRIKTESLPLKIILKELGTKNQRNLKNDRVDGDRGKVVDSEFKTFSSNLNESQSIESNKDLKTGTGAYQQKRKEKISTKSTKVNLNGNSISELDEKIKDFFDRSCDYCHSEPDTWLEVKAHYREKHDGKKGYLKCCGRKFDKRIHIENHISWHLNPKIFACSLCGKSFKTPFLLKNHLLCHTDVTNSEHVCELCNKRYVTARQLRTHMNYLHPTVPTEYICDICQSRFKSYFTVRAHILTIHSKAFEQVCHICARTFKTKQNMIYHLRTHEENGEPRVQCTICDASLKNTKCLREHLRRIHNDKPSQCKICNTMLSDNKAYRRHMDLHKEAKHCCFFCGKSFKFMKALKDHIASHTGQNLHSCPYCPKTFASRPNTYKHFKRMHLELWNNDRLIRQELLKKSGP